MVNRAALILRYKEPAIQWINDADPSPKKHQVTAAAVNEERTVYLIPEEAADDRESLNRWIKANVKPLFENELESWYTDPAMWPKNRSLATFRKWFEIECNSVIIDTVGQEIVDEEI